MYTLDTQADNPTPHPNQGVPVTTPQQPDKVEMLQDSMELDIWEDIPNLLDVQEETAELPMVDWQYLIYTYSGLNNNTYRDSYFYKY